MKVVVAAALLLTILFMGQTVNTQDFVVPIPCSNDDYCNRVQYLPSNAVCRNGYCICNEGGVMKNCTAPNTMLTMTKISGAIIGRICKHHVDCKIDNGVCNSTVLQCLCRHGFVSNIDGNKCLPAVSSIGGRCEDNKQCLANFSNTTCLQNQCVCIGGFHQGNNVCFKSIGIGETCKHTQECSHIDYAECNQQNVCACSDDSIFNSDGNRCLPRARELSQHCTDSTHCNATLGMDAECISNRCQCASSTHFVSKIHKCVVTRHIDESCENDYNCYQDELSESRIAMNCVKNICTCASGYIKYGVKCVVNTGSVTLSKISVILLIVPLIILRL